MNAFERLRNTISSLKIALRALTAYSGSYDIESLRGTIWVLMGLRALKAQLYDIKNPNVVRKMALRAIAVHFSVYSL